MADVLPSVAKGVRPPPNPVDNLTGFVDLQFNTVSLTLKPRGYVSTDVVPQYLQAFEFQRMVNGIGFFSLTLVDEEWTVIEDWLLQSSKEDVSVRLRYGMLGQAGGVNISPFMRVKIFKYDLDPSLDYCIVNVQGLCLGFDALGSSLIGANTSEATGKELERGLSKRGTGKISDYVRNLAISMGFRDDKEHIIIDETSTILSPEDLGSTDDVAKILTTDNVTKLNFLVEKLVSKANSIDKNKTPFVFFISTIKGSDGTSNEEVFHFHRADKDQNKDAKYVYTLFSDKDMQVISFKPSYDHTIVNVSQGNTVVAYGYDHITGASMGVAYGEPVVPTKGATTSDKPALRLNMDKIKRNARIAGYAPATASSHDQIAQGIWSNLAMSPLTAELVVVGNVEFNLTECIDIYVNIPAGPQKGAPHNTTGRYIIFGITDTIRNGVFETSLSLGTGFGFTPAGKDRAARASSTPMSTSDAEKSLTTMEKATAPFRARVAPLG